MDRKSHTWAPLRSSTFLCIGAWFVHGLCAETIFPVFRIRVRKLPLSVSTWIRIWIRIQPDLISRARIFKRLWNPGIDSKASIPPAYVAWRAGTITLFLYSMPSPHTFFKHSSTEFMIIAPLYPPLQQDWRYIATSTQFNCLSPLLSDSNTSDNSRSFGLANDSGLLKVLATRVLWLDSTKRDLQGSLILQIQQFRQQAFF